MRSAAGGDRVEGWRLDGFDAPRRRLGRGGAAVGVEWGFAECYAFAHLGVEAGIVVGCVCGRRGEEHFLFFLFDASFAADQVDPFFSVGLRQGFEVVIARGGEEAKDVVALVFGIFEERDSSEVREEYFVAQFGFVLVFVDGYRGWAEDEVDLFPRLETG